MGFGPINNNPICLILLSSFKESSVLLEDGDGTINFSTELVKPSSFLSRALHFSSSYLILRT